MVKIGFGLAAVIGSALALAACGGDGEDGGGSGGTATVSMGDDLTFAPASIEVPPGATITWENDGDVPHDVVARSGASFRSPLVNAGEQYETSVGEAGTIDYVCTLHPGMKGTIVVSG